MSVIILETDLKNALDNGRVTFTGDITGNLTPSDVHEILTANKDRLASPKEFDISPLFPKKSEAVKVTTHKCCCSKCSCNGCRMRS